MDADVQKRLDQIVEDEIQRGYRIKAVPDYIVVQLRAAAAVDPSIRPFSRLRFTKPTPRKRRMIQEIVMERYNQDLKNEKLLSTTQLKELAKSRGEWTPEMEKRLNELSQKVNEESGALAAMGISDRKEWASKLADQSKIYLEALDKSEKHPDEKEFLKDIFTRWSNFLAVQQTTYDNLYATKQGTDKYYPDKDFRKLLDTSPSMEATEALMEYDELLAKVSKLTELIDSRSELAQLLNRKNLIFSNSIESRRDQCEELANLYYTTEVLDAQDKVTGQLTETFDGMWDYPDTVIRWLLEEFALFQQNIPESMREELEDFGFLAQVPEIGTSQPSDASLEAPNSKPDMPPVGLTDADSLESAPAMT